MSGGAAGAEGAACVHASAAALCCTWSVLLCSFSQGKPSIFLPAVPRRGRDSKTCQVRSLLVPGRCFWPAAEHNAFPPISAGRMVPTSGWSSPYQGCALLRLQGSRNLEELGQSKEIWAVRWTRGGEWRLGANRVSTGERDSEIPPRRRL